MITKEKMIKGTIEEVQDYLKNVLKLNPYVNDRKYNKRYNSMTEQILKPGFNMYFYLDKGHKCIPEDGIGKVINITLNHVYIYIVTPNIIPTV